MQDLKQNFNGGYIKASQEAYDLLIESEYKNRSISWSKDDYFTTGLNGDFFSHNDSISMKNDMLKPFYINNGALSWDEPIQISSIDDLDNLPSPNEAQKIMINKDLKIIELQARLDVMEKEVYNLHPNYCTCELCKGFNND